MNNFKFTTLQKIIIGTAVLPLILFLVYLLVGYLESIIDPEIVKSMIGSVMVGILAALAINTLLLPLSIFQIVSVFRNSRTYHRWILLPAAFVGPIFLWLIYSSLSNAVYM